MAFITKPVLTVDIVEFSKRPGREQMIAIQVLIQLLRKAIPEDQNHPSKRIWSPAGDGGALTFWDDLRAPVETAVNLGRYIDQYNKGELELRDARDRKLPIGKAPLQLRMGIHAGPVSKEVDFDDRENVWGNGMNMSARVASLAQVGQIVASHDYYIQAELKDDPEYEVVPIGKWWAKHNMSVRLYNIYKDGVGIPTSEVGEWFEPFQYPLRLAIGTYSAMADEEIDSGGRAFRVLVLAKRLLDLNPQYQRAREMIESVSLESGFTAVGEKRLFDDFFSHLSPNALLFFFRNAEFRDFERDTVIFEEGSKADSMMMVVSGEIEPYLGKERIPDVVLKEGHIIGEMGLLNPSGEKRTATLIASRNTITLSLNYDYLRVREGERSSERDEIRGQIWRYYRKRTSHNQVHTHALFKSLPIKQRDELLKDSEFLPVLHNESIQLGAGDLWEDWFLVAEGSVDVHTTEGRSATFTKGDCLGPIRLAVTASPYDDVEVADGTHLVRLRWESVKECLNKYKRFRREAMLAAGEARERLGLTW